MTTETATPATEEERKQAEAVQETMTEAQQKLDTARKEGTADLPELEGFRGFVAPIEQNTRFLAVAGKVVQLRDPNSPTGMRDADRAGDKFVQFINGSFITDDPDLIKWCEEHDDICRDVDNPMTSTWYMLKLGSVPLKNRESSIPSELNIDAALAGDLERLGGEASTITATRQKTHQANDRA